MSGIGHCPLANAVAVTPTVAALPLYDLYVYAKRGAAERRTPGLSPQPITEGLYHSTMSLSLRF